MKQEDKTLLEKTKEEATNIVEQAKDKAIYFQLRLVIRLMRTTMQENNLEIELLRNIIRQSRI